MSRIEASQPKIREIRLAADRQIRDYVLKTAGQVEVFPTTQLRGPAGYLVDYCAVVVDHGVPVPNEGEGRVDPVLRDAVVLLPGGLFVGRPVETPTEDGSYSTSVPAMADLEPAPLEAYSDYGGRALTLLDQTIRAQH